MTVVAIPALDLVPLPVVVPLAVAVAMLALAHFLPVRIPDIVTTLTSLAVAAIAAVLAVESARSGMLVYWFGGWTPRPGVVLGIGFGVDAASAGIAAFVGLLFAAATVFAWGYFDEVHAHFHVLMLLFLGAMEGFCLTRDLFNLFVWFEVMSVAACSSNRLSARATVAGRGAELHRHQQPGEFHDAGELYSIYAHRGARPQKRWERSGRRARC